MAKKSPAKPAHTRNGSGPSESSLSQTQIRAIALQISGQLKSALKGPTKNAALNARYIGAVGHEARAEDEQSRLEFWGHKLPLQRELAKKNWELPEDFQKKGFRSLGDLSHADQWKVWLEVWTATSIHDLRSIALIWLSALKRKPLWVSQDQDLYKLAEDIDNWALSDGLSSMLAHALEQNPKSISIYETWNKSPNPWLRRQSLVGLYCYARQRKTHFPAKKALKFVEALLQDPHFYVQRAVGWTLREIDRVDSNLQRAFVRKNLGRISGVAWFATSELYPESLKKELVALRKQGRTRNQRTGGRPIE